MNSDGKTKKNFLLVFRNKKINVFDAAETVVASMYGYGYSFDKIAYVAYDLPDEIIRSIKDGRDNFENVVILCPKTMEKTLKDFISRLYAASFDDYGVLKCGADSVFILYSDFNGRLLVKDIADNLNRKYAVKYDRVFIRTAGAPASLINSAIEKAKSVCPETEYNVCERYGDCCIEITYSENISKMAMDEVMRIIVGYVNDYVYALDNTSLAERLFQLLKLRRMKIGVAESFTGGGIGRKLVEVPGISEVYMEGLNTYSNESKMRRLNVGELTLKQHGAVSEETASEMALGLLRGGLCDICISTTGIAGPKSDNTLKPVGLIYIGIATRDGVSVYRYDLKGDRETITNTAINLALFLAYKTLK